MGYGVKWIEEHLGITRKALRNYEDKGLMPKEGSRDPKTNYRNYSENEIERLWTIKILQGIGFSVKEIESLANDPSIDFYEALKVKIEELETRRAELDQFIGFAKTVKMSGQILDVAKVGSMRFEEFIQFVREKWNVFDRPEIAPFMEIMDDANKLEEAEIDSIDLEQLESLIERLQDLQSDKTMLMTEAYFSVLCELKENDYRSETAQAVVRALFKTIAKTLPENGRKDVCTPEFFARQTIPSYVPGSDLYLMNVQKYGEEACRFIAEAVAVFGGYESVREFYKEECK